MNTRKQTRSHILAMSHRCHCDVEMSNAKSEKIVTGALTQNIVAGDCDDKGTTLKQMCKKQKGDSFRAAPCH